MATRRIGSRLKLPLGLRQALERGDCVLFLGPGVGGHYKRPNSAPAPDGKQLCIDLVHHFKLDIDPTGRSLAQVSQLAEIRSSRAKLNAYIKKTFRDLEPDDTIQWLTGFRWRAIVTTNYDLGIERAYAMNPKALQNAIPISVTSGSHYAGNGIDVPVFHLHGTPYKPAISPMVITQTDYAHYQERRAMLWNRLKAECATSTILYLGCSGHDDNWQAMLEEIGRAFAPAPMPVAYRIDPFPDDVDVELHRKVRNVQTIPVDLAGLRAMVEREAGDYRDEPDTYDGDIDRVSHRFREAFHKNQAAMLRLLNSWDYGNGENLSAEPNVRDFVRGSKPNCSLVAPSRHFMRDVEEDRIIAQVS